jgi:excisionase family DNA binding protein
MSAIGMDEHSFLDVREAAALLGIAPGSLYHWLPEGRGIPVVRLSPRFIRFRLEDVLAWIAEKCIPLANDAMVKEKSKMKRMVNR